MSDSGGDSCHMQLYDRSCLTSTNIKPWEASIITSALKFYCCLSFWLRRLSPALDFPEFAPSSLLLNYNGVWKDTFGSSSHLKLTKAPNNNNNNNHNFIPEPGIKYLQSLEDLELICSGSLPHRHWTLISDDHTTMALPKTPNPRCRQLIVDWYSTSFYELFSKAEYINPNSEPQKAPSFSEVSPKLLAVGTRKEFATNLSSILETIQQKYSYSEMSTDSKQRNYIIGCFYPSLLMSEIDARRSCHREFNYISNICDLCAYMDMINQDTYILRLLQTQYALYIPYISLSSSIETPTSDISQCTNMISFWSEAAVLGTIIILPSYLSNYTGDKNGQIKSLLNQCVSVNHPFYTSFFAPNISHTGHFLQNLVHVSAASLASSIEPPNSKEKIQNWLVSSYGKLIETAKAASSPYNMASLYIAPYIAQVLPWTNIKAHIPRLPEKIHAFHRHFDLVLPFLQQDLSNMHEKVQPICQLKGSVSIFAKNKYLQELNEKMVYHGSYSGRNQKRAPSFHTMSETNLSRYSVKPIIKPLQYSTPTQQVVDKMKSNSIEIVIPRCCETLEGDLLWLNKLIRTVSMVSNRTSSRFIAPNIIISVYYKCPHCLPRQYASTWHKNILLPNIMRLKTNYTVSQTVTSVSPNMSHFPIMSDVYEGDDGYQQIRRQHGILLIDDFTSLLMEVSTTAVPYYDINTDTAVVSSGRVTVSEIPGFDWQSNGKEATAYLQHLRDRHSTLASYTFFLHTQPGHHLQFGRFVRLLLYLHTCTTDAMFNQQQSPGLEFMHLNFRWFSGIWARAPERCTMSIMHYLYRSSIASTYYIPGDEIRALPGIHTLQQYLQQVPMAGGVAAQFIVSRRAAQQRPASFYARLYHLLTHQPMTTSNSNIDSHNLSLSTEDQNRYQEIQRHCRQRSYSMGTEVASAFERLWANFFRAVKPSSMGSGVNPLNHKFVAGSDEEHRYSSPLFLPDFPFCCQRLLPKFVWHDPTDIGTNF